MRHLAQHRAIQPDAGALHSRQHWHQRHLHLGEQGLLAIRTQVGNQQLDQARRHVHVGAGIGHGLFQRHLVHCDLFLAGADELGDLRHRDAQPAPRQVLETQRTARIDQPGGDHGVEQATARLDPCWASTVTS